MAERGVFVRDVIPDISCGDAGTADAHVMRRRGLERDAQGVVVVVHGLGDAPVSWFRCLRNALPDHRMLIPAIPGAGRGPLPAGRDHITHREARAWLASLLSRILADTQLPVRLVGHSLGGWLVAAVLLEHPEIAERTGPPVLVNTAGVWYPGVARERDLLSPRSLEDVDELLTLLYAGEPDLPIEAIDAMLSVMRSPAYQGLLHSTVEEDFLREGRLGELPEGVGVVWGLEDGLVPPIAFETLSRSLRDPRIIELDGVGHAPHTEAPQRCAEALASLVAGTMTKKAVSG